MKTFVLTAVIGCATLFAAPPGDIEALIDAVLAAPPQQRYEKMNAFKRKMRELNAHERSRALRTLHEKYGDSAYRHVQSADAGTYRRDDAVRNEQLRLQQHRRQTYRSGGLYGTRNGDGRRGQKGR